MPGWRRVSTVTWSPAAEALVAAEPLRERRWAILALAQYRCGRQADALRALTRARRAAGRAAGDRPRVGAGRAGGGDPAPGRRRSPPPSRRRRSADDCPYKGLAAYDVDDAEAFFGRDGEVAACLERLRSTPLLVVTGPSGCGKSSLVRAGLVPALAARRTIGGGVRPRRRSGRGDDRDAVAAADGRAGGGGRPVRGAVHRSATTPTRRASVLSPGSPATPRDRAPVVVAVRADHLAGLVDRRRASPASPNRACTSSARWPATRCGRRSSSRRRQAGLRLEAGLVDLLVRDCEGEPGALPLLSHALAETWRRRDGHVLTVEGYRATGGIRGAVARSADRLYDSLPAEQRAELRGVLLRLVAPSPDGDPVRSRVADRARSVGDRRPRPGPRACSFGPGWSPPRRTPSSWPTKPSPGRGRGCGRGSTRTPPGNASCATSPPPPTAGTSLGRPDSELYRGARLEAALEWRRPRHPDLTEPEQRSSTPPSAAATRARPARWRTVPAATPVRTAACAAPSPASRSCSSPPSSAACSPTSNARPRSERTVAQRSSESGAHRADQQRRGAADEPPRPRRPARRRGPPPGPERGDRVGAVRHVHRLTGRCANRAHRPRDDGH